MSFERIPQCESCVHRAIEAGGRADCRIPLVFRQEFALGVARGCPQYKIGDRTARTVRHPRQMSLLDPPAA